jgi:hypothetical protein
MLFDILSTGPRFSPLKDDWISNPMLVITRNTLNDGSNQSRKIIRIM